jgi:hypothetical protein
VNRRISYEYWVDTKIVDLSVWQLRSDGPCQAVLTRPRRECQSGLTLRSSEQPSASARLKRRQAEGVGRVTQRSKGGGPSLFRPGGHERSYPPDGLGLRRPAHAGIPAPSQSRHLRRPPTRRTEQPIEWPRMEQVEPGAVVDGDGCLLNLHARLPRWVARDTRAFRRIRFRAGRAVSAAASPYGPGHSLGRQRGDRPARQPAGHLPAASAMRSSTGK